MGVIKLDMKRLQELMLERNLVIRALPKYIEYKFIYNSARKAEYDKILVTNKSARIEMNDDGTEYIVYREKTSYVKDSFIVAIKNGTDSTVDSWDWIRKNNKLVVFNTLEDILKYFE